MVIPPSTPGIRVSVCLALSGVEKPGVAAALLRTLTTDRDGGVRGAAATALGGFATQTRIREALLHATQADGDARVRLAAYTALQALHAEDAALIARMLQDADAAVVAYGVRRLAALQPAPPDAGPRIIALAGHASTLVRQAVLHAAPALLTTPDTVRPLIAQALRAREPVERRLALELAVNNRLSALAGAIKPLLRDPDAETRAAAVDALFTLDPAPATLDEVVTALRGDKEEAVELALVHGIARLGAKQHAELLDTLLAGGNLPVRQAACDALYRLAAGDRPRLISTMLKDASMRVNLAAVRLIERSAQPALLAELPEAVRQRPTNTYAFARWMRLTG